MSGEKREEKALEVVSSLKASTRGPRAGCVGETPPRQPPGRRRYARRATLFSRGCLEFENLVVVAIGVDGVVQLVQEFRAVAGQEIDRANAAFLQGFVGIERVT